MKTVELKYISENLIDTFDIAGKESIDLQAKGLKIEIKEDKSPVSNGDLRVNELITNSFRGNGKSQYQKHCENILAYRPNRWNKRIYCWKR